MDTTRSKPPLLARLGIYTLVIAGVGLAAAYYLGLFAGPDDSRLAARQTKQGEEKLMQDALAGSADAQRQLGYRYETGSLTMPVNIEESIKWYTLAAEQNDERALMKLGLNYMRGKNVPKDIGKARYWFEKAATIHKNAAAAWNIALIYSGPNNLDPRKEIVLYWIQKAIDNGGFNYALGIGDLYYRYPEQRDYTKAFPYYQLAAEKGNSSYAMRMIGYMYEKGQGTESDIEKAGYWVGQAAGLGDEWSEQHRERHAVDCRNQKFESCRFLAGAGNAEAQRLLALAYYQGQFGLPHSMQSYLTWITKAAESGSPRAQITLADTYAGKVAGFAQTNPALAHAWYAVAAHYEVTPALKAKLEKQSADALAALPHNTQAAAQALAQKSIKKYQVQNDVTLR